MRRCFAAAGNHPPVGIFAEAGATCQFGPALRIRLNASGISDGLLLAGVAFAGDKLIARFGNGSSVSVQVNRYPRLQNATPAQRNKWRLIGKGSGIH